MLAVAAMPPHLLDVVAHALERSDDLVAVLHGDNLQVIGANEAFRRLTGIAAQDAEGERFMALLGVASDDPANHAFAHAARMREAMQTELRCVRRDGTQYWIGVHLMPAQEHRSVVLCRDITARRQTRARQEAVEALLATVFRHVDAAVAIVDAEGRLLMTNPQCEQLLGFTPGTLGRQAAIDFVAAESHEAIAAARAIQLQDGQPFNLVVPMLRPDASRVLVRLNSVVVERPDLQRFRVITLTPLPPPTEKSGVTAAGKLRLVGLQEVKAVLGERWSTAAERALQTAEHILQRRLGPRDSFSRTEEQGLLICFSDLTEEEASQRAAAIGREIRQRLIGLNQGPAAGRLSGAPVSGEIADAAADGGVPLAQVLEERLHARRGSIEATARRTLETILRDGVCELHRVQQRDGAVIAHYARFPPGVERRIAGAAAALPTAESGAFDIDVLRLTIAVEQAQEAAAGGARLPVLIDVSFEIFETRTHTDRYADVLRGIDARAREQIVLMITGQPDGITESRLRDCMTRLRPYCREVGLAIAKLECPPPGLIVGGKLTVGIACETLMLGGVLGEEALFQFLPILHARRGRLLVSGIPSVQIARDLREIGVDMMALSPPSDA